MLDFLFCVFFCVCFTLLSKTHYLSRNVVIAFAMLIYIVYFSYSTRFYRLKGYQDTAQAALIFNKHKQFYE